MKKTIAFLTLSAHALLATCLTRAAAFQNLDFDSALIHITFPVAPDLGVGYGPTTEMLPAWHLFAGTNEASLIGLDLLLAGLGYASLYDTARPTVPSFGLYSLGLVPGFDFMTQAYRPQTLVQVGDVPMEARSIRFINYGSPFELRVNNTLVPLLYDIPAQTGDPNVRLFHVAGDISAYAGMNAEFKFTTLQTPFVVFNGLDSISFSTESVPEPGTLSLFGAGLVLLLGRGWRSRSRK
jgi:hypothetical protein